MPNKDTHARKLLLVDDEPDIIEFLSYNFRKEGYDVFAAYDGLQALQLVNDRQPDAVITDILMPKMNGILMCERIKKDKQHATLPVIFLSASNDDLFAIAAMKAGGTRYVSKPIRFNVLSEMISEVLNSPAQKVFKRRYKRDS